jgi:signal transduction histidine kinase
VKRLELVPALRRRMLPLVAAAGLVVAGSAPVAFYAQKRGELVSGARTDAHEIGRLIVDVAHERPRLWRYDSAKLSERIAAGGLGPLAGLVIRDARGADVPIEYRRERRSPERRLLWGHAPVVLDGATIADVWVAIDPARLDAATAQLALGFAALAILLAAILYLLPMRAIASAQRRIATLLGQLAITFQEDDRRRIARDLHDGAGQALTAARLRLLALRRGGDAAAVEAIAAHLDEALDEIRRSTSALLPPALVELGLAGAVERHCRSFGEAAGLTVECELSSVPELPAPIEVACYRIIQEALSNTARHAGATHAWVKLGASGGQLRLEIRDDGVGLDDARSGAGLDSIRERARLIGGRIEWAGPGAPGARLEVRVPLLEELA